MSKRFFEAAKHADLYAKYRPSYGEDIYERIFKFCRDGGNRFKLAVDIGCGSGQSTKHLTQYFEQVVGVDVSPKQVEHAASDVPNLKFEVGFAESFSTVVPPDTADLVTIAQAIHWVDTGKFYREVEKVLRPGGAMVVYGYGNCTIDNPRAQEIISKFYWSTLKGYWDDKRDHINTHYREFSLPYHGSFREESLKIVKEWTVDQFVGYVSSWSGWQSYLNAHPSASDLEDIRKTLTALYQTSAGEESKVNISWPVFMLLGQKPKE
ncbi:putative methyltransferase DDB_G0268948 isoform X1 [Haliotis rufescens]|uniref:putative methyltransferase DDB_G0268948 isoform X1 n=1 Tax=Haliotis rufescens TaxID=6454 RepID=UPI001EAF927D|nr:putative methyltransferase DDB_G0268948 isoform X1 [Haliotis rufescens]